MSHNAVRNCLNPLLPVVWATLALTALTLQTRCWSGEAEETYASLTQTLADAQNRFEALNIKTNSDAITALDSVVACKHKLLEHVVKNTEDFSTDQVEREIRSLARTIAKVAGLYERKQEFELGQAEWVGLASCCERYLGVNCPEYWDASQEADALGRLAAAGPAEVQAYLANRAEIRQTVARGDLNSAFQFAIRDHEHCCLLFGETVPRAITSLEYAAKVAYSGKQFEKAFKLFENAAKLRVELYPSWHPTLAKSILSLGSRYESRGLLVRAEASYRRVEPSLQQLSCLTRLANKHRSSGQSEIALRLFEEVFQCCSKTVGEDHPLRGLAGFHSGDICRSNGNYQQAIERLMVCTEIWKNNANPFERATCLNSIALAHQLSGNYAAAITSYLAASKILKDDRSSRGVDLLRATRANYASLLEESGRFPEALKIYEGIVRETDSKKTLSSADLTARENLARLYQSVGELAKAETLLESLLQFEQRPQIEIARLRSLRGRFYLQLGILAKADQEIDLALKLLSQVDNAPGDVEAVRSLKALIALERDELPAALERYEGILKSLTECFGAQHARCAETYDQIAKVQRMLGNYEAATEAHSESIEIYRAVHGPIHEAVAWAYHRLGTTHFVFKSPEAACRAWRQAFEIKQKICRDTLPWLPEAQAAAFLTSLTTNDSSAGRDTLLSTLSSRRVDNAAEAFECVWRSRGLVLNAIALRERQLLSVNQLPEQTKLAQVRQRLAQLSVSTAVEDDAHQQARTNLLQELNQEKESLERAIAEQAISEQTTNIADEIKPEALLPHLNPRSAFVQIVKTERWLSAPNDSRAIEKTALYDAFVVTQKRSRPDPGELDVKWITLGEAEIVEQHIDTWRTSILRGEGGTRGRRVRNTTSNIDTAESANSRDWLNQNIWKPISAAIGNRSQVIIVPDGSFYRMPWIALPGSERDYLIEEVQITTAADGRQLVQLLQQKKTPISAGIENSNSAPVVDTYLLVGGVEYDSPLPKPVEAERRQARASSWPFLSGTKEEVSAISEILPQDKICLLQGAEAQEAAVKAKFEDASVVHIATHGYFADNFDEKLTDDSSRGDSGSSRQTSMSLVKRNPLLQCGLTLAGCNSDIWIDENGLPVDCGQDGYLSAEEIMGMDLSRATLVVLSACETGLGRIESGEGVFGLQRALHISGVKSTIASGWKVDDRATQILMTTLYRKMSSEGLSPADALRAAQIELLRNFNPTSGELEDGSLQLAPPYYWAAFSLSGVASKAQP
ncbi:MAG: CHAT domain-containing protein [Pirellulaceae bacterium]